VRDPYPRDAFAQLESNASWSDIDVQRFVRLHLLEGIPFAFRELPLAFEIIRERIADALGINPQDVSLVGSGRIGFSLASHKALQDYKPGVSDLDLLVISEELFHKLVEEYEQGVVVWRSGRVAVSEAQQRRLVENEETTRRHRLRGFFDSNKVPKFPRMYTPLTTVNIERNVRAAIFALGRRYMGGSIKPPRLVRVYRSRNAAILQNVRSVGAFMCDLRARQKGTE
jgi:hypothetical protein